MNSVTASFSCTGSWPGGSGLGPTSSESSSESSSNGGAYFEGNEGPMRRWGGPDDKHVWDGDSGFTADILVDRCRRRSGGSAGP